MAKSTTITRQIAATGTPSVDGLIGHTAWTIDPSWSVDPAADPHLHAAVARAVTEVRSFTDLTLPERAFATADLAVHQGETLRLAGGQQITLGAHAFFPADERAGGDMHFGAFPGADLVPGEYGYRTVLHELAHALGLTHADEAGRFASVPAALDSMERSVMSSRSAPGARPGTLDSEPGGYARTFMVDDIAALQHLYGARYVVRDDVYRFDPAERALLMTVWDGGGTDTYDFSRYAYDLTIDLRPGHASTTGQEPLMNRAEALSGAAAPHYAEGAVHNAALYKGDWRSGIENAVTGRGDDHVRGNKLHNHITGGAGEDTLDGRNGRDTLDGGAGNDRLKGGNSADHLFGGAGDDALYGHSGSDTMAGGTGHDTLKGELGRDTLSGEAGNDVLEGGDGRDRIDGGDGDDNGTGGRGDDQLFGGAGADRMGGAAGNDTVRGEAGDDTLTGGSGNDVVAGGEGNDTVCGEDGDDHVTGADGDDALFGGNGADTLRGGPGATR